MKDIKVLFKRLERVNTELNMIEEGWPWRLPSNKRTTMVLDHEGCSFPQYAVAMMQAQGDRLKKTFPVGWEFVVHGFVWGGQDTGCIMDIFVNGSSFACVRFCVGDESGLKTKAHCVGACIDSLHQLVTNAIARLQTYPLRTFKSAKYKELCDRRRKLNREWRAMLDTIKTPDKYNVPGPYAYPYGKHKKDWPVFEGMHLGK